LRELFDTYVDGDAAGRANVGIKAMTLVLSALAGGDCIDDAGSFRSASTERVLSNRQPASTWLTSAFDTPTTTASLSSADLYGLRIIRPPPRHRPTLTRAVVIRRTRVKFCNGRERRKERAGCLAQW
jgi:hypothetical protein